MRFRVGRATFEGHFDLAAAISSAEDRADVKSAVRMGEVLHTLGEVIAARHRTLPEGSYTKHLFMKGASKIRKKTGEEAVEFILATDHDELRFGTSDLIYHLMVLVESEGMRLEDVVAELAAR